MPDVGREEMAVLGLYQRCRRNGVLPRAGSLGEQPAVLMGMFDVIDDAVQRGRAEAVESMKRKRTHEDLVEGALRGA